MGQGCWVHKLPENHEELFGDDRPRGYYLIIMKVFDFWEMHPLRPELVTIYQYMTPEAQAAFKKMYVKDVPLENIEGHAPSWHFDDDVRHRSKALITKIKDGIRVPCTVWYGKGLNGNAYANGFVYEGRHRAGAAKRLGWKTIPAFVINTVGKVEGFCHMTKADREEMRIEQAKRGLPDTSQIHGHKIRDWTEEQRRQFMVPRPRAPEKLNMRGKFITNCIGEAEEWKNV